MATTSCTLFPLALVLLFFSASAADIVNPGERCRQEIATQDLEPCGRYLQDSSHCGRGRGSREWREAFPLCCDVLEHVNEACRCDAIQKIVEQERAGERRLEGIELEEMMKTAKSLPTLCRISQRSCLNAPM